MGTDESYCIDLSNVKAIVSSGSTLINVYLEDGDFKRVNKTLKLIKKSLRTIRAIQRVTAIKNWADSKLLKRWR